MHYNGYHIRQCRQDHEDEQRVTEAIDEIGEEINTQKCVAHPHRHAVTAEIGKECPPHTVLIGELQDEQYYKECIERVVRLRGRQHLKTNDDYEQSRCLPYSQTLYLLSCSIAIE